jgi:hypothetical protein
MFVMDVLTIAQKTGLSPRSLRYSIYHGVAAGIEKTGRGKGISRNYTDFEAFGIAVVTKLMESGLKRDLAKQCVAALLQGPATSAINSLPLYRGFMSTVSNVHVDVADNEYVRLRGGSGTNRIDTGWRATTSSGLAPENLDPEVLVSVKLTQLRDALRP